MIERFSQRVVRFFRPGCIAAAIGPGINTPDVDRKTKADVRREILRKLSSRLNKLDVPKAAWNK